MTKFDRDSFAEVQGSSFALKYGEEQAIDLELVEVSESKETKDVVSFSLLFAGPDGYSIQQGMYDLEHPSLGAMQLFLVPVGMREGGSLLEAVFNLLRDNP